MKKTTIPRLLRRGAAVLVLLFCVFSFSGCMELIGTILLHGGDVETLASSIADELNIDLDGVPDDDITVLHAYTDMNGYGLEVYEISLANAEKTPQKIFDSARHWADLPAPEKALELLSREHADRYFDFASVTEGRFLFYGSKLGSVSSDFDADDCDNWERVTFALFDLAGERLVAVFLSRSAQNLHEPTQF